MNRGGLTIFGEVLFDVFPDGARVLGGAPFNVAWHLQALGDRPLLLSRVGDDTPGEAILQAMAAWGMDLSGMQRDALHPTGEVRVAFRDREPQFRIVADCAYDFIAAAQLPPLRPGGILYHGSLGLRHPESRAALEHLCRQAQPAIFLDVNLRSPWWRLEEVEGWLKAARWVKLNQEELARLGYIATDLVAAVTAFQERFALEQVILTRGAAGALVRSADGELEQRAPEVSAGFVDAVGAGDAFSAVYLHGLLAGWPVASILEAATGFAGRVVGLRGATTDDPDFYRQALSAAGPA